MSISIGASIKVEGARKQTHPRPLPCREGVDSTTNADTDYRIVGRAELYLQNALFTFFRLLGLYVQVERATSEGRMDMVVQTRDQVYIFEFKIDKSADAALRQIEEKGYARPFAADPRRLYKIGVSFDSQKRCVTEWKVE